MYHNQQQESNNYLIQTFDTILRDTFQTVFREERKEIFNFKNRDCQEVFFNLTEHSTSLRDCFQNSSSIEKQGKKWFKTFKGMFSTSFKKIRITKKQKETPLSLLFKKRLILKDKIKVLVRMKSPRMNWKN